MALLVAVVAAALALPLARVVANDQRAAFISNLEVDTLTTAASMSAQPKVDWQKSAEEAALRTGARVVVVSPEESLVADSDRTSLDRQFDRPEITAALAGSLTSDVRTSVTLGEPLRYVAAPIIQNYDVVGAVRLSLPESIVDEEVQETQRWLIAFVVAVVVGAGVVAWLLARSISSPLKRVAQVAEALPDDLDLRADERHGPHEVRSVAAALNSTAARLSGILRRTQRVAADASHHLRTPLTGVRLRLEAIEDISDQEQVKAEARAATGEVDRLAHRIEQVLSLARSDVGAVASSVQDVSEIVRGRVDAATGMFDENEIALRSRIEPEVYVLAPTGAISRIVDELLGNALQYARSQVRVEVTTEERSMVLAVADDGPGVPEEEREAVFERFRRGSASVAGGSGLGLALVRETASGMAGRAWAERSDLGGLLVVLRMPLVDAPTRTDPPARKASAVPPRSAR
jgi:signal transduction histidine kinase